MGTTFPTKLYGPPPNAPLALNGYESPAAERLSPTVVQTLKTELRARTMALNPKTHKIYLASAKFGAGSEQPSGGKKGRPSAVAGTFKVLVYGMEK